MGVCPGFFLWMPVFFVFVSWTRSPMAAHAFFRKSIFFNWLNQRYRIYFFPGKITYSRISWKNVWAREISGIFFSTFAEKNTALIFSRKIYVLFVARKKPYFFQICRHPYIYWICRFQIKKGRHINIFWVIFIISC